MNCPECGDEAIKDLDDETYYCESCGWDQYLDSADYMSDDYDDLYDENIDAEED
jgi:hypothetical protein